ncbi:TPA: DUF1499 domain-containing protein [Vibrio vulnificus]|uniref:DUF1499 domain-containing protein n=1 Tax=Vibrio vulnificus TaxID=672 RepID=UPI0019D4683A|nr:DUF1499 domain-containing protein [Vibrio vulnificus]MBN8143949.1 DUF1499 domain-containing protein [Vibrio vulnificus]HAS6160557.1 DUF1499 domain-containing protein [Vibrio vulnificus]HDY7863371.1 DUF1499 domain-containing protein [Vibrio vulnificus]HDY7877233.1 DUF1499 domain-containing protein [Vibrio vulnificus]
MKKLILTICATLALTACSNGAYTMTDRTSQPCGNKPNCVSTQDERASFQLGPFKLTANATLDQIEQVALELPGAKVADKTEHYLRVECTSRLFRFVDDLELKIVDGQLLVRSESRVGYSDLGVNRKRAEQLRSLLTEAGFIE